MCAEMKAWTCNYQHKHSSVPAQLKDWTITLEIWWHLSLWQPSIHDRSSLQQLDLNLELN